MTDWLFIFRHFPVILGESDKKPCNYDYYNDGKGRKYPADLIAVTENTENIRRKFPKAVLAGMTMQGIAGTEKL